MVSAAMYEKRFGSYFAAPVIAGLEENGTPYLCGMDSIGAMVRGHWGGFFDTVWDQRVAFTLTQ